MCFAQGISEVQGDFETQNRINFIQTSLDEGKGASYTWWYSWTIFYGVTSGLAYSAAFTINKSNEADKMDNIVTGTKALLGLAVSIISPDVPLGEPDVLCSMPDNTPLEQELKLKKAESILSNSAFREQRGRSFRRIVVRFMLNVAGSAVILMDRDIRDRDERRKTALKSFTWGTIAGGVQYFTQPVKAVDDWKNYQLKYKKIISEGEQEENWFLGFYPGGFVAGLRF